MTGRMVDEPTFSRTKAPDESPDRRLSRQRQQFVRSVGGLKTPTPDECPAPPTPPDERQQTTRPFDPETNVKCADYHAHQNGPTQAQEEGGCQDRLRKACYRMAREGWLDKNGKTGPRVTWGLNVTGGPK